MTLSRQKAQDRSNCNRKKMILGMGLLMIILCLAMFVLAPIESCAKDFGVRGKLFKIKEKDAIEEIQEKLKAMEASGQIDEHNQLIKERLTKKINKPSSLNLSRTEKEREFSYDPSIEVKEDLKDIKGQVFQEAGTRVNPLDRVDLRYELMFFDADDEKQLEYALIRYKEADIKPKLILTGGSPIEIEKAYGLDVYFDQRGVLVKRLGISHVPAIVYQKGKVLNIREVKLTIAKGAKIK